MERIPFTDPHSAAVILDRIQNRQPDFGKIKSGLLTVLAETADPDRSLVNFERFSENYGPEIFSLLDKNPRGMEVLCTLFSASHFLTEILLRNPPAFNLLLDRKKLTQRKTLEQILSEAEACMRSVPDEEKKDALRRYQHDELLRIGASDFLDMFDLPAVVSQLSRTAIALTRVCLSLAVNQTGISSSGFTVLAMGKLGGRELNYSSDIDLIFITRDDPNRYIPLAQKLIDNLTSSTSNGFLYRVDLRLRPWGNDGPLIATLPGFMQYLEKNARLWEKQALLKVRPIAGDLSLGEELRDQTYSRVINLPENQIRAEVFAMKQRTEEILREKGREWGEVKLGVGSIRDIEFVVQYLQLVNLRHFPQIRTRATIKAINFLRAAGLLTAAEARILHDGYIFLRTIEHYLQMMDYRQTYTLPADQPAIRILARRLGFSDGESFILRYQEHCQAVRDIFLKFMGGDDVKPQTSPEVSRHISRMDDSYRLVFTDDEILKHTTLAGELGSETPVVMDVVPEEDNYYRVTIVAYDLSGRAFCPLWFALCSRI